MGGVVAYRSERTRRDLTGYVGMVVALAAWAMMFGTLFFAYGLLRARAPVWPPPGAPVLPLGLPGLNTLVAIGSSALLQVALARIRRGEELRLPRWIGGAMALGVVFLALQALVWRRMALLGLAPASAYGGVFWSLTVFHAIHVLAGLGVLAHVLRTALRGEIGPARAAPLRFAAMFWHFVGAVWVFLYLLVYVA